VAVYVDDAIWRWAGRRWCHLMADEAEELHRFAAQLGLKRSSYQGPPKTSAPHYDITGFERDRAVRLGAIACGRDEIVTVFRRVKVPSGKVARPKPTPLPLPREAGVVRAEEAAQGRALSA
jgi:hypothetical protein